MQESIVLNIKRLTNVVKILPLRNSLLHILEPYRNDVKTLLSTYILSCFQYHENASRLDILNFYINVKSRVESRVKCRVTK